MLLIHVQKGVFQGDCLSPLLFNMCVNTLIKTIDNEKLKCLGYAYNNTITPKHWFQFADDTAIVTALESDNQLLVNVLSKWSQWADLKVRVDKCHVFGMKKKLKQNSICPRLSLIEREFRQSKWINCLTISEKPSVSRWIQKTYKRTSMKS